MTAGSDTEGAGRRGTGHPDLETLADLQEGLLGPAEQRRVRQHVAKCVECGDALAALDATQAMLRELPPVAMPEHVAARIDRALGDVRDDVVEDEAAPTAAAGATTVVPAPERARWWRSSAFATSAAAAAVVLLIAGGVAFALRASNHDEKAKTPATSGGLALRPTGAATFSATSSGRNYTARTLAAAVPSLLGQSSAASAAVGSPTPSPSMTIGSGSVSGTATQPGPFAAGGAVSAPPPALTALRSPQRLLDCVAGLTGQPAGAVTPLATDLASFQGKPAAVIVLPAQGRPALVDVWVVGPGCNAKDQQLIYFLRMPRPR